MPNTKRTTMVLVSLVLIFITSTGVFAYMYYTAPSSTEVYKIKVGHMSCLSGAYALTGWEAARGILMAAEEINAEGGLLVGGKRYVIDVILADSEGSVEKGVAAINRLISEDEIDVFVGGHFSSIFLATMSIFQEKGIPAIDTVAVSTDIRERIIEESMNYVFQLSPTARTAGITAAEYTIHYFHPAKVALCMAESAYAYSDAEAQEEYYAENAPDVEVKRFFFSEQTTMFYDILALVDAWKPDVLYFNFLGAPVIAFTKQFYELGLDAQPTVRSIPGTWLDDCGEAAEGWVVTVTWSSSSSLTPLTLPFAEKYNKTYGHIPGYNAPQNYDGMLIMAEAIKKAGSLDKAKIAEALEEVSVTGVRGYDLHFTSLEDGHQMPVDMFVAQVQDGKLKVIWPLDAAEVTAIPYVPPG